MSLVRIPGVGKKTAERIVLELKDKFLTLDFGSKTAPAAAHAASLSPLEFDVLSALLNLGCSRPAAEEAIRKVKQRGVEESFEPFFSRCSRPPCANRMRFPFQFWFFGGC